MNSVYFGETGAEDDQMTVYDVDNDHGDKPIKLG